MPLLIDGHNLIGQIPHIDLADADDEIQLVMLLRRYTTRKRGRKVIVVFDRGVYGHRDNLNGYGVECYFAKSPHDADKELIRRIRIIKRISDWQVITSDRAVAGEARARGIAVLSAHDFAKRLVSINQPTINAGDKYRNQPLSPAEVQEWLRIFGLDSDPDSR